MSRVSDLQNLVDETKLEMEKFYDKGNKAAGTRARKGLQDLKKLAQDIRLEIQSQKNSDWFLLFSIKPFIFWKAFFLSITQHLRNKKLSLL